MVDLISAIGKAMLTAYYLYYREEQGLLIS